MNKLWHSYKNWDFVSVRAAAAVLNMEPRSIMTATDMLLDAHLLLKSRVKSKGFEHKK